MTGTKAKLYKVLNTDGSAHHGGVGSWNLPKGKRPGKWMQPIEGKIRPCANGYHLCRATDLLEWLGPAIFEAEHKGEIVEQTNKVVVRHARLLRPCGGWNDQTARLFAADCAERVLHIFEEKYPDDDGPRKAIMAAREFARGEIDDVALASASASAWASASARASAGASAWASALASASASAWASASARASAGASAWASAGASASASEKEWQHKRLLQYLTGEAK